MGMTAHCPHCQGGVAFEDDDGGAEVACPHCGQGLRLPMPGEPPPPERPVAEVPAADIPSPRRESWPAALGRAWGRAGAARGLIVGAGLAGVVLVLWVGQRWWVEVIQIAGSAFAAVVLLAVGCFVAILAILWLVFPLFVYMRLNRVVELLQEIARQGRQIPD